MTYNVTSTLIHILSGTILFVSLCIIALGGTFHLWVIAKILYGVGALLFLFNK